MSQTIPFNPANGVTTTPKEDFYWRLSLYLMGAGMLASVFFSHENQTNWAIAAMGFGVGSAFTWVIVNLIRELRGTGPNARYEAALKDVSTPVLTQLLVRGNVDGKITESAQRAIRHVLHRREQEALTTTSKS